MSQQQFLQDIVTERVKKVDPLVLDSLVQFFTADLPIQDYSYIERRLREVISESLQGVSFHSPELHAATKAFLKKNLQEMKKKIVPPRKFSETCIPPGKEDPDLTELRDKRCEPLVYDIIEKLLDDTLLFSEEKYMKECSNEYNQQFFQLLLFGFVDSFFNHLELSLQENMRRANEILWDGRAKENITFKQVDAVLKTKKEDPKYLSKKK